MTTFGKCLTYAGTTFCFATISSFSPASDFCTDNLDAAVGSLRAARLELGELENASDQELCQGLKRYVVVTKAARVVFEQCLTGTLREEMLGDADASTADIGGSLPILCSE